MCVEVFGVLRHFLSYYPPLYPHSPQVECEVHWGNHLTDWPRSSVGPRSSLEQPKVTRLLLVRCVHSIAGSVREAWTKDGWAWAKDGWGLPDEQMGDNMRQKSAQRCFTMTFSNKEKWWVPKRESLCRIDHSNGGILRDQQLWELRQRSQ